MDYLMALEGAYRDAVAAMNAAFTAGASRADRIALADIAYDIAIDWSRAASRFDWNDAPARKMSARADSAIWDALNAGGGGGR